MANELTHALFAGAVMAVLNPFLGLQAIGWNVFLAGMVGMLLNLDRTEMSDSKRSPMGHSLGFVFIWLYVLGCVSYLYCVLTGTSILFGGLLTLAVAVGLLTHLLLDAITGHQIFTIPNNLRPKSWLAKVETGSDRFWGAWDRTQVSSIRFRDSQVNVCSLAVLLVVIGIF